MIYYELKSKKTKMISIVSEEEVKKLKSLKLIDHFKVTEIKPIRQIHSPFKEDVQPKISEKIEVVKKKQTTKTKTK